MRSLTVTTMAVALLFVATMASILLSQCGCSGKSLPKPTDPGRGRAVLVNGLDAWQQNKKPDELQNGNPSIRFNDEDWMDGSKLVKYEIAEAPNGAGNAIRWRVTLTLEITAGKTVQKKVVYRIQTEPSISVIRQDP